MSLRKFARMVAGTSKLGTTPVKVAGDQSFLALEDDGFGAVEGLGHTCAIAIRRAGSGAAAGRLALSCMLDEDQFVICTGFAA